MSRRTKERTCKKISTDSILYEYETAIKARNFHYENFNYWANFYAIIVGALFVAYYTIGDTNCNAKIMLCLTSFLGCIVSLAWLQVIKGHYHWLKNWINIVLYYEEKKVGKEIENRVYSLFYDDKNNYFLDSKNISTQKVTIRVVFVLLIAWMFLFIYSVVPLLLDEKAKDFLQKYDLIIVMAFLFVLILMLVFVFVLFTCGVKSNIDKHYKLIKREVYEIIPPEK